MKSKWTVKGKGKFRTWTLKCRSPLVQIFPPATSTGSFVAYIDDKLFCNTYKSFEATEAAVLVQLRRLARNITLALAE